MISLLILLSLVMVNSFRIINTTNFQIATYERDDIVSNIINNNGEWEPHFLREIDRVVENGGKYFLDIGAHIGYLSLYALSKGMTVVAFEPLNKNLELLSISLSLNPQFKDRWQIYEIGLSDTLKDCDIYSISGYNTGNGNLACDDFSKNANIREKRTVIGNVKLAPLDFFLNELPHFDLIKIDIEGYEPYIYTGGINFFIHHIKVPVLMEFGPFMIRDQGTDPYKFLVLLQTYYTNILLYNNEREIIDITNDKEIKRLVQKYGGNAQVDIKLY